MWIWVSEGGPRTNSRIPRDDYIAKEKALHLDHFIRKGLFVLQLIIFKLTASYFLIL